MIALSPRACSILVVLACLAVSARANETSFGPTLLSVSPAPNRVAAGDLDGDGRVDIVSVHANGTIAVLRSLGAGNFAPPVALPAAPPSSTSYASLALADVDGDTDLDVIAVDGLPAGPSNVYTWQNLGNLSFAAPTLHYSGSDAQAGTVGDVNGDGLPDVVVVLGGTTDALAIILNAGSLTWLPTQFIPFGAGVDPVDVALADVDGDLDLDVVTANANATLAVSINTNGAFASPVFYPSALANRNLALLDFDADGDMDAAVSDSARQVKLYANDGTGAFVSASLIGITRDQSRVIVLGDLDAHGCVDVVVGDASGSLAAFTNMGLGAFSAPIDFYSGGGTGIALADVDGDHRIDALVPMTSASRIGVHVGDGRGGFGRAHSDLGAGLTSFGTGDVNGDGRLDLVGASSSSITVRLALAEGGFGAPAAFSAGAPIARIEVGDVDDDPYADVFVVTTPRLVVALRGDAQGGLSAPLTLTSQNSVVAVGDFNGDGRTDIAHNYTVVIPATPLPYIFFYHAIMTPVASGFPTSVYNGLATVSGWVAGDLNADGIEDLLIRGPYTATLSNGSGGLTVVQSTYSPPLASVTAFGDVNGDGFGDGLIFASGQFMPGDGAGGFGAPLSLNGLGPVTFGDFTGDGRADALGSGPVVACYEGTSNGLVLRGELTGPAASQVGVRFADMNGDGRREALLGTSNPPGVVVVSNRGAASGPVVYCTAKTTSNGCVPAIGWSGTPNASATSGFTITCTNAINNAPGLLVYSPSGRMNIPFQGGTLCVGPGIFRTPIVFSGGNPGPMDCSGAYTLDFNAFAHGLAGGLPLPILVVPGTAVTAQWYGRDAFSIGGASLSNALDFVVGP